MRRILPLVLLAAACSDAAPPTYEPAVPEVAGARLWLMYATRTATAGIFGGLDGALEPGVTAVLHGPQGEIAQLEGDAQGRFRVEHPAAVGERLRLDVGGVQVDFRVRDPATAREDAVHPSLGGVGLVPNDLVVVGPPESSHAVVVRSGDNAVNIVDLAEGLDPDRPGVRLPSVEGADGPVSANPWLVTALDEAGTRVAVTAFGQRSVYVVDLSAGRVERVLVAEDDVVLEAPFVLAEPFDVDGDGVEESEVSRFAPRNPQPVAVVGDHLVVAFANVLRPDRGADRGPVYLPGVVVRWRLDDLDAPPTTLVLPFLNPQELRPHGDGRVLVTCSGAFRIAGVRPLTPGAVMELDVGAMAVTRTVELPDFAPTTALWAADRLWVGSLGRAKVVGRSWSEPEAAVEVALNDDAVDSIFRLVALPGGLIGVPSFNTDRLHVLDPRSGRLDPEPFFGPIAVGPGPPVLDGLQIAARRPGRPGVDFIGPDVFVLFGLASQIVPVELRKILGP